MSLDRAPHLAIIPRLTLHPAISYLLNFLAPAVEEFVQRDFEPVLDVAKVIAVLDLAGHAAHVDGEGLFDCLAF